MLEAASSFPHGCYPAGLSRMTPELPASVAHSVPSQWQSRRGMGRTPALLQGGLMTEYHRSIAGYGASQMDHLNPLADAGQHVRSTLPHPRHVLCHIVSSVELCSDTEYFCTSTDRHPTLQSNRRIDRLVRTSGAVLARTSPSVVDMTLCCSGRLEPAHAIGTGDSSHTRPATQHPMVGMSQGCSGILPSFGWHLITTWPWGHGQA